ncbi:hypothetical protein [Arthrobacter sp. zg-Y179]|uniref:hypothetical protein n=1 Tax=Arthrobacter sp. zg-Y179 TaxID=2894188 RepID=UPI001E299F05|nr:hypothetical protein [Arthrobacter sp. zg-Y179]MCC9175631.1 hypothetical protein [Arthrobacter sp. zg-Y179]
MSNNIRPSLPAKKVLTRTFYLPIAVGLGLAVYFAVTGEWLLAAVMSVVSLSTLAVYPWYKRQLASRDAAAPKAEGADGI